MHADEFAVRAGWNFSLQYFFARPGVRFTGQVEIFLCRHDFLLS